MQKTKLDTTKKINNKKSKFGISFLFSIIFLYIISSFFNPEKTLLALIEFFENFVVFLPFLIGMIILIELVKMYINKKDLVTKLKKTSGIQQKLWCIFSGIFAVGPLYMWHPLLNDLQKSGVSWGNIATFIYARSIKLVYLPVLFYYFDYKYIVSLFISLLVFSVIQGVVIDKIMEK